jgi:uncharacterized protein YndB with AHSA1/START domain
MRPSGNDKQTVKELTVKAARYNFVSEYILQGERQAIWRALVDFEHIAQWWEGLKRLEIVRPAANGDGTGLIYRNYVRAPLGYTFDYSCEVVGVDPLRRLDLLASGELVGRGRFLLADTTDGSLRLTFHWMVETPKVWITLLTPIARPVFTRNHHRMMISFGVGLARASRAALLSTRNTALSPAADRYDVEQRRHALDEPEGADQNPSVAHG